MKTRELIIEGMSCHHCVMAVQKALGQIVGLTVQSVEVGRAKVQYDEAGIQEQTIKSAIEEAGFVVRS